MPAIGRTETAAHDLTRICDYVQECTRELVISGLRYVAIYRVRDEAVEIIRILHGAQKWP